MRASVLAATILSCLYLMLPGQALADVSLSCLTAKEARAAVSRGHALSLARIKRLVETRLDGDILRARLCERGETHVYMLIILHRSGYVRSMTVDALTGQEEDEAK